MIRKTVLDNGVRVISEALSGAHSVAIGVWVENGSRHELPAERGLSHLLEHMLFKGTERRSALEIAREIDSVGGMLNAFTSREYSCYYAKVLAQRLPLAIDLLSDVIRHPRFDLDDLEKERRVVLQELHMVEDTPDDLIHDLFSQIFWQDHPLGSPVLGTTETVRAFDRDALIDFLRRRYTGESLLVCAAGDLDHDELVDQLNRVFGDLPATGELSATAPPGYGRHLAICDRELEQVHLCFGTRALSQNHPDRFSAYLLNGLLGGSMSSRLFQKVREERGLAYSIYSYLHCHSDGGALVVHAGTAPDDARSVVEIIQREMRKLCDTVVPEKELMAVREQLRGNLLLSLESTENRMTRLAKNEIYLGGQIPLREVMHAFDRVTGEDVQALARSLFRDEFLNLQLLGRVDPADFPEIDLTLGRSKSELA